ncbi:MAG: histidine kinase [Rubrivivax sp.]|nr:histidine kinase [Rubrivivax sp.]
MASLTLARGTGAEVATLWLANAPVTALLMQRTGHARYALAAVGLSNALVNLLWGSSPDATVTLAAANVVSITMAVFLLRRLVLTAAALYSPAGLVRVLWYGAFLPELIGAALAAALMSALGVAAFGPVWVAWVQGGWIGSLVMLPLSLLAGAAGLRATVRVLGERPAGVLLPLCVGGTLLSLAHLPYPFVILAIPLVWAAATVSQLAHAVLALAVALTASVAMATGAFLPAPVQSHWEGLYVPLSLLAALLPTQMLAAALAQQRAQMALLAAQTEALRRANDGLEQFVRVASHDLREPLNTVVQFARLAEEDAGAEMPPAARRYLGLVARAGARMRELLDDILRYARLQREELGEAATLELAPLLAEVQAVLAGSVRSSGAEIAVGPLPAVRGHAPLLLLMFQNLVGNAIKFVPPGVTPAVNITAERVGARVHVTVADNGIGIDVLDQPRLFKPFSRLHLRRRYEGTGLGLSIVAHVVRLHGGEVRLSSEPGRGSRFTVDLPAAQQ